MKRLTLTMRKWTMKNGWVPTTKMNFSNEKQTELELQPLCPITLALLIFLPLAHVLSGLQCPLKGNAIKFLWLEWVHRQAKACLWKEAVMSALNRLQTDREKLRRRTKPSTHFLSLRREPLQTEHTSLSSKREHLPARTPSLPSSLRLLSTEWWVATGIS